MKRLLAIGLMFMVLTGFSSGPSGPPPEDLLPKTDNAGLTWYPYVSGMKRGKELDRKIMLLFTGDDCKYCDAMERDTFHNPRVADILRTDFVLVKVNMSRANKRIGKAYSIRGVPVVWFLKPTGDGIGQVPGYEPPGRFLPILMSVLGRELTEDMVTQETHEE